VDPSYLTSIISNKFRIAVLQIVTLKLELVDRLNQMDLRDNLINKKPPTKTNTLLVNTSSSKNSTQAALQMESWVRVSLRLQIVTSHQTTTTELTFPTRSHTIRIRQRPLNTSQ
jgi:hypothetical protein